MKAYKDRSKEELLTLKNELEAEYKKFQEMGLKLDMSRGCLLYTSTRRPNCIKRTDF